jgi:hypothetical protein
MNDDLDALRSAWQGQASEVGPLSPAQLRAAAARFEQKIRRRNLVESAAGCVVAVVFTAAAFGDGPLLSRLGNLLVAAAGIWIVVALRRRGRPHAMPADPATDGITWQIGELTRQRDLVADVWRWYLGPFIPGVSLVVLGAALATHAWLMSGVVSAGMVLGFGLVGRYNASAVRSLDADIRALEQARSATASAGPPPG